MQQTPALWVIVLCYNGIEMTLECLASLKAQTYANLHILIVDNASQDGTAGIVRREFPDVQVLETGANLGYAGGNNAGMRLALSKGAELLFLLNNDTLLEPTCLQYLVESMACHPSAGAVGPMVYTADPGKIISSAGGRINWQRVDSENVGMGELDRKQFPARPIDFANGCGLLVSRQAVEQAGFIDEAFFMYWEETDWQQRIRKKGFEIWFEPKAVMVHKAPIQSSQLKPVILYYMLRNRLLFFARHTPIPERWFTLARAVYGGLKSWAQERKAGRSAHAHAVRKALFDALFQRWGRAEI